MEFTKLKYTDGCRNQQKIRQENYFKGELKKKYNLSLKDKLFYES